MPDTNRSPALGDYQKGADAYKAGNVEISIAHFKRATEVDPKFYRAWAYLAMAYARAGKIDEAIDTYRKCIDVEPGYHKAYNNIGELYRRKGLLDYAAMVFKMATEIDANQAHYFYNLGITYLEIGMMPQAEEALASAVKLSAADFDFSSELAQAQFYNKHYSEAARTIEDFLGRQPDHERAAELRARLALLKRKVEEEARAAAQVSEHPTETRLAAIDDTDDGESKTTMLPPAEEPRDDE
jgi:Tfp pilus assembly protein PilF